MNMDKIYPKQLSDEIISYLPIDREQRAQALKDFKFYQFNLSDLGLPSADELLESVLKIESLVGTRKWAAKTGESKDYYGFSLMYNPEYAGDIDSIYHQTWGSSSIISSFSGNIGKSNNSVRKNTYNDTYSFRSVPPIIEEHLGYFLNKFSFPILRSRVAFYNPSTVNKLSTTHIDEPPTDLLRINIPLQTSKEHLLDVFGKDEYGNALLLKGKHLEVGKAYLWNTRIPHRVYVDSVPKVAQPRIHIVLGLSPWFDYNKEEDYFVKSKNWSKSIHELVTTKAFLK